MNIVASPGLFRLFLATVVLVHHSFTLRLGAWAVGLFFVLSGYWISFMWSRQYSKKRYALPVFYVSRWWRLAPLFIVCQICAVIFQVVGSGGGTNPPWSRPAWLVTQFTIVGSTQFGRILPPAWSLDVEMQFYLIAPFMLAALAGTPQSSRFVAPMLARLCLVASLLLGSLYFSVMSMAMEGPQLHLFLWLFVLGAVAEQTKWKPSKRWAVISALGFVALVVGCALIPATRGWIWITGSSNQVNKTGQFIFYILSVLIAAPYALSTVHRPSSKWDQWYGDLSYPLYLIHWLPRDWYYARMDLSLGHGRAMALLATSFLMAFLAATALLQCVDRPAQRWRKAWVAKQN